MSSEEEIQKDVDALVKSLKPIIESFLKEIDDLGYELDDNGDLVPKKSNVPRLTRKDRSEYE